MGEAIKTAAQIAAEKVAKIGAVSEEDRLTWKFVPEGEKIAGRYMKEDVNLNAEISKFPENGRPFVKKGLANILVRGIVLPRNEAAKKDAKKAMDGLKMIKSDKAALESVFTRVRRVFDHYTNQGEQQRQQSYQQLKMEFSAKVQQAMAKQMGGAYNGRADNVDIDRQPQFQEEWRRLNATLDAQYQKLLDEYRQELELIT